MKSNRPIVIAGNWKMNHGPRDTGLFFATLRERWKTHLSSESADALKTGRMQSALFVPAVSLAAAKEQTKDSAIHIGSQNTHWEAKGAFTGEISAPMLKELGISWTLVGHSERRQYFGETDETVRKRKRSLLEQGFTVMLCVGETREQREKNETEAVLYRQLTQSLSEPDGSAGDWSPFMDRALILAYEPVWAIGTGLTATPEQAQEAHAVIRRFLETRFGTNASAKARILYGGSVTPENIDSLLACPDVDGALVGGASLKPESLVQLLDAGGRAASSRQVPMQVAK